MKISVVGGLANFTIHIPRPDNMIMLFNIPKSKLWELKKEMEESPNSQLMFVYPVGDFQKLAYKPRPYGARPRWETYNQVTAVPSGLVLEIIDVLEGEIARSMPIPWEVFQELERPIKEMNLKW